MTGSVSWSLDERWKLATGLEYRSKDDFSTTDRWSWSLAAGYSLTRWLEAKAGYELLVKHADTRWPVEHRYWFSLTESVEVGRVEFPCANVFSIPWAANTSTVFGPASRQRSRLRIAFHPISGWKCTTTWGAEDIFRSPGCATGAGANTAGRIPFRPMDSTSTKASRVPGGMWWGSKRISRFEAVRFSFVRASLAEKRTASLCRERHVAQRKSPKGFSLRDFSWNGLARRSVSSPARLARTGSSW